MMLLTNVEWFLEVKKSNQTESVSKIKLAIILADKIYLRTELRRADFSCNKQKIFPMKQVPNVLFPHLLAKVAKKKLCLAKGFISYSEFSPLLSTVILMQENLTINLHGLELRVQFVIVLQSVVLVNPQNQSCYLQEYPVIQPAQWIKSISISLLGEFGHNSNVF
ncbi:uncharacterized protein LOC116128217 [Pistacia vera]|uniref:uncharacterized protein LOC116128217 n=1 Tax=Pistacia vera TaxID=55513 RepID=UPI0012637DE2|nr:uncharacterized protein LOC116128217 [Pistacia vera]